MERKRILPGPAAVLRSIQKDEEYTASFKRDNDLLFQKMFGIRSWIQWRNQLDSLSRFAYYAATTLTGLQTLGEEYVRIVQVDGDKLRVPSFMRRLVMILMQTTSPLLLDLALKRADRALGDPRVTLWPDVLNQPDVRDKLTEWLPRARQSLAFLHRCHLVLFYFFGTYYEASKRVTSIKYTSIRSWLSESTSKSLYRLLGYLTLSQLVLSLVLRYYSSLSLSPTPETEMRLSSSGNAVDAKERCSLCLEKRLHSTATPCGHLFCWQCINEWIALKSECPLCREKCEPTKLIYLQNY